MVKISKLIENGKVYFREFESKEDLFTYLAEELYKEGYVKETFLDALKKREAQYPTGIISKPYNIALPHVDSEHINKDALIVIRLKNPIKFNRMDNLKETIDVQVVFLLLIADLKKHMVAISSLTRIWMDESLMTSILEINNKEELLKLIEAKEIDNA